MRFRNPTRSTALRYVDRTPPGIDDGMAHGFPVASYRATAAILDHPDYVRKREAPPLVTVRLADLRATQEDVERACVALHLRQPQIVSRSARDDKPLVARYRGQLYILDGHHRLTALRLKGRRTARVRFVDLDATENPARLRHIPHTTPEHMPLALKVALGVAGVWGAFALVNAVFRAKVASAVEGAIPGLTVNPTPPTSIPVTPASKASVQLAGSAAAASTYDLLSSVALTFPSSATATVTPASGVVTMTPTATGVELQAVAGAAGPALVTVSFGDPSGKTDAFVSVGVVA